MGILLYILSRLPNRGVADAPWHQYLERARRIAKFISRARIAGIIAVDFGRCGADPCSITHPSPHPDLRGEELFLDIFARTPDFAAFLRIFRRTASVASGINGKARAWEWPYNQIRTGVQDPLWCRRVSLGAIGIIFAQLP